MFDEGASSSSLEDPSAERNDNEIDEAIQGIRRDRSESTADEGAQQKRAGDDVYDLDPSILALRQTPNYVSVSKILK